MLEDERSVKFGLIFPKDEGMASETPSGDKASPSGDDRSPSGTEESQKEAIASGTEGGRGRSGIVGRDGRSGSVGGLMGNAGIEERCAESSDSNLNVETISSASTCFSRLEVTNESQTPASNSPSE